MCLGNSEAGEEGDGRESEGCTNAYLSALSHASNWRTFRMNQTIKPTFLLPRIEGPAWLAQCEEHLSAGASTTREMEEERKGKNVKPGIELFNDWNIWFFLVSKVSFPAGSDGKESTCSAGDLGSIPGSGRSPGEGNSNQLQYSCLGNSMDRKAWRATVHWVKKSETGLSDYTFTFSKSSRV